MTITYKTCQMLTASDFAGEVQVLNRAVIDILEQGYIFSGTSVHVGSQCMAVAVKDTIEGALQGRIVNREVGSQNGVRVAVPVPAEESAASEEEHRQNEESPESAI